jgi:hypothetical protein
LTQVTNAHRKLSAKSLAHEIRSLYWPNSHWGESDRQPPQLGDVDAIAEDISLVDYDVANVYADADFNPPVGRQFVRDGSSTKHSKAGRKTLIALRHPSLCLNSATGCVDGAAKFNQYSITSAFDDAATMLRDCGFQEFPAVGIEACERALFVGSHKPGYSQQHPRLGLRQVAARRVARS